MTGVHNAVNRSGEIGRILNGQSYVAARLRLAFCQCVGSAEMTLQIDDRFPILRFTAIVKFASDTATFFELAHVSKSGFTRTTFGSAAVICKCSGAHANVILLSLPDEYSDPETLSAIQKRLFEILELSAADSWWMSVSPRPTHEVGGPLAAGYVSLIGG